MQKKRSTLPKMLIKFHCVNALVVLRMCTLEGSITRHNPPHSCLPTTYERWAANPHCMDCEIFWSSVEGIWSRQVADESSLWWTGVTSPVPLGWSYWWRSRTIPTPDSNISIAINMKHHCCYDHYLRTAEKYQVDFSAEISIRSIFIQENTGV